MSSNNNIKNPDISQPEPIDRETQLIQNLSRYRNVKDAALASGYTLTYANSDVYKLIRKESFQRKVVQYYNGMAAAILPQLIRSESAAILAITKTFDNAETSIDPKEQERLEDKAIARLSKLAPTAKQIKQATGVLSSDQQAPSYVQIDVKTLINNRFEGVRDRFNEFDKPLLPVNSSG